MSRFTERELSAFRGQVAPCTIAGPVSLYRFSANPTGAGGWWVPQDVFSLIYEEARDTTARARADTVGSEFRRLYRKYLAISLDWNDLEALFRMDVPPEAAVSGWAGITKAQPVVSARGQARLGRAVPGMLAGGLEQVFLEHVNVTWIRRVSL